MRLSLDRHNIEQCADAFGADEAIGQETDDGLGMLARVQLARPRLIRREERAATRPARVSAPENAPLRARRASARRTLRQPRRLCPGKHQQDSESRSERRGHPNDDRGPPQPPFDEPVQAFQTN